MDTTLERATRKLYDLLNAGLPLTYDKEPFIELANGRRIIIEEVKHINRNKEYIRYCVGLDLGKGRIDIDTVRTLMEVAAIILDQGKRGPINWNKS